MVKLFVFGLGVSIGTTLSASAILFAPRLSGIARYLGGSLRLPFQSPIAQATVDAVNRWLAPVPSSVRLAAALGLVAFLLVCIVGALVAHLVRRRRERQRAAELHWCTYVMADRAKTSRQAAEYEALWK
jgi:hypothetical protein